MHCQICGDRLPRASKSPNCTPCSSWAKRIFTRFFQPSDSIYDIVRQMGVAMYRFQ